MRDKKAIRTSAGSTVPMIPRIHPALATPRPPGGLLPASIAFSSWFPITQADGPIRWRA